MKTVVDVVVVVDLVAVDVVDFVVVVDVVVVVVVVFYIVVSVDEVVVDISCCFFISFDDLIKGDGLCFVAEIIPMVTKLTFVVARR